MYNVKYFKYPAGWQVRVYDSIVGYHKKPDRFYESSEETTLHPLWDEQIQEYVYERVPLNDTWFNPFTMKEEKAPVDFDEKETERKKKRSIASSMGRTVNAIYRIARSNTWDWFVTFTFDPGKVDSYDYVASVRKLSKWLNNMRAACPGLGYLIVPERHKSGRYHFHGLFRDCDALGFVPSGKSSDKGDAIYNVGSYRLGFTTATAIKDQSRVTKYIAKYINKDLCQVAFNKKRYWSSRNLADAEMVEAVLDKDKLDMLIGRLESSAIYVKRIENGEVTTTYYELPEGVDDGL